MPYSPILLLHILAGTLALPSGAAAILFRKGSRGHIFAGRVFVGSMLTMASAATYLGIVKDLNSEVGA